MNPNTMKIDWLSGTRILLLGHYVPAPLACYLLHHLGAEVIKLEDGGGDHLRQMGNFQAHPALGMSPMFWTINAGFKSVALQYRKVGSQATFRALVQEVDVIIDGHRAGATAKYLGANPTELFPNVIHVPITAYGLTGPMSTMAGHDNNVLALGGNLSYTQLDAQNRPTVFSAPVADFLSAHLAAIGTLAALVGRKNSQAREGQPRTIDASMLHAGFFLNLLELSMRNSTTPDQPRANEAWMNGGRPDYRSYRCSDGHHIFFGLIEPWACKRFFMEMGREDLAALMVEPSLLGPELETFFQSRSAEEWEIIGKRHDACITRINDLDEAMHHPQILATGRLQSVESELVGKIQVPSYPMGFGEASTPIAASEAPPLLGQHNEEILQGLLGMDDQSIQALYDKELLYKSNTTKR